MALLRCAKCGSNCDFLVETRDGKMLEVRNPLHTDRIKATVRVTCTYCNSKWDHVPITLVDPALEEAVSPTGARLLKH